MIKDSGVIREPRGINWQNWTATCKDVVVQNIKLITLLCVLGIAAFGGIMLTKHASSIYGHFEKHTAPASGPKVNVRDTPAPIGPATKLTAKVTPSSPTTTAPTTTTTQVSSTSNNRGKATSSQLACTPDAYARAQSVYSSSMASENNYYLSRLSLLGITPSLAAAIGNSGDNKALSAENDRHKDAVSTIQDTLKTTLNILHC